MAASRRSVMDRPLAFAGIGVAVVASLAAVMAAPLLEPSYEVPYYAYITEYGVNGNAQLVVVYDLPGDKGVEAYVDAWGWVVGGCVSPFEAKL